MDTQNYFRNFPTMAFSKIVSLYAHQLSHMYARLVMLRLKLGNSYLNMHEGEFDMLSGMELLNGGRK